MVNRAERENDARTIQTGLSPIQLTPKMYGGGGNKNVSVQVEEYSYKYVSTRWTWETNSKSLTRAYSSLPNDDVDDYFEAEVGSKNVMMFFLWTTIH